MTEKAIELSIKSLVGFEAVNLGNANASLENSIMNCWQGLFIPKADISQQLAPVSFEIPLNKAKYLEFLELYPKIGNYDTVETRQAFADAVKVANGEDVLIGSVMVYGKFMTDSEQEQYVPKPIKWLKEEQFKINWQARRKSFYEKRAQTHGEIDPERMKELIQGKS